MSLLSGFVKLEKHFLEVIGYILYPSFLLDVVASTTIRIEGECFNDKNIIISWDQYKYYYHIN